VGVKMIGYELRTTAGKGDVVASFQHSFCRSHGFFEKIVKPSKRVRDGWRFDSPGRVSHLAGTVPARASAGSYSIMLMSPAEAPEGCYRLAMFDSDGRVMSPYQATNPIATALTKGANEFAAKLRESGHQADLSKVR
jgi:hypothetical protein